MRVEAPAEMMINSGLNFSNCGKITFSNAARNLAPPSSEASGALTILSCSPRSAAGAGARKQRHLMRRAIHHGRVGPEYILGAVAVMDGRNRPRRRGPMPYLRWAWRAAIAALSKKQNPIGLLISA